MVVILEGMKRSGKTTFANKLEKYSCLPVYSLNDRTLHEHANGKYDIKSAIYGSCHTMVEMAKIIENTTKHNCLIIFDRLHISELVYGKNIRGYESEGMWDIDKQLISLFPLCFFFYSKTSDERTTINSYYEDYAEYISKSKLKWKNICLDETKGEPTKELMNMVLSDSEMLYQM